MSIEIDVLNGDESWSLAEGLFERVWPKEAVRELSWGHIKLHAMSVFSFAG